MPGAGRGRARRESYLDMTMDEVRESYVGVVGRRMVLVCDGSVKSHGPRRVVRQLVDVRGSYPCFLACETAPDRRGRTRLVNVTYSSLACGDASLEEAS